MRIIIFILLLLPSLYLYYEVFVLQNLNDPINIFIVQRAVLPLSYFFFTTSISLIKKSVNLLKYRRMIGLFGFYYAFLHMLNFVILDMELDFFFAIEETLDKPFVYLGMFSFVILLFMALTSFKNLYRRYNKYHKALYLVLILITIHFIMAQKSLSVAQYFYILIILIIGNLKSHNI